MKYVAIFAVVIVLAGLTLNIGVPQSEPLTELQLDEAARMRGELSRPSEDADVWLVESGRRVVVDVRGTPIHGDQRVTIEEPSTPLQLFLDENPTSPLQLLPPDEAAKYLSTRENLVEWIGTVDAFADVDVLAVEYGGELSYLWKLCKEHQALRAFCIKYQTRERERWSDGQVSVALEDELQPALGFIRAQFGDDVDVWSAIDAYSRDVIGQIYGEGDAAAMRSDVKSRWDLLRAFSDAGRPSFDAVGQILLGD